MEISSTEVSASRRLAAACGAVGALLWVAIVLGHDGRRVAQVMALAIPVLAWMLWPVRSAVLHRFRSATVWLWAMAFVLDGIARAYLLQVYQAAPDSSFVQSAIANTNVRESEEYIATHWRATVLSVAEIAVLGVVFGVLSTFGARRATRMPPWIVAFIVLALAIASIGYVSKPWRRLHPLMYWTNWTGSVLALRAGWADQQKERDAALDQATRAKPIVTREGPATLVLVVTESVNRDNLSLYGYMRPTTPQLQSLKAQLGDQMVVFRNAWSVDASTLASLQNIFNFGQQPGDKTQHVLALARASGYKVWWISNHDDVAIEQQHGRLANVTQIVNRIPGRAGDSLDGELLDDVESALGDPAHRKLIVVHLIGVHPHYNLRYPAGRNAFGERIDDVEAELEKNGRSRWVRKFRQEYDSALLYHDSVVSKTLQMTRDARNDDYRAWMYLSDHGQEVGHSSNHAGHSPSTASGYRIPTIIWRNDASASLPPDVERRPFRADWAGWSIARLLNIEWSESNTTKDALDINYRWDTPVLPAQVLSFTD